MSASTAAAKALEARTMRAVSCGSCHSCWPPTSFVISTGEYRLRCLQMNKRLASIRRPMVLAPASSSSAISSWKCRAILRWSASARANGLARIMITWGLASGAFALIGGPTSFLCCDSARCGGGRVLPRCHSVSDLLVSRGVSRQNRRRLHGCNSGRRHDRFPVFRRGARHGRHPRTGRWQWIFILEAVPAILLGIYAFIGLTDRPEHANWLARDQQSWLIGMLNTERTRVPKVSTSRCGKS